MQLNRQAQNRNGQYFDMETLLTRALYKVLKKPIDSDAANSTEKSVEQYCTYTLPVVKPVRDVPNNNSHIQMRLLAQQICNRVEKKFEKRLHDARSKDLVDIEKRLKAIREEYQEKCRIQENKLEKEKERLLDRVSDHERAVEHRLAMRWEEKEADIEARKRILDNRTTEMKLNLENFEKIKKEWERKVTIDEEAMKLEKERISIQKMEFYSEKSKNVQLDGETRMWMNRCQTLEEELKELRLKYQAVLSQQFSLTDKIASLDGLKNELEMTTNRLAEERKNSERFKKKLREMENYERLKEENDRLRDEVMRNRAAVGERDILLRELNEMKKLALSKQRSKQHERGDSTSSLSEEDCEVLDIKKRIMNLDELARSLDQSLVNFSHEKHTDVPNQEEAYDDFCRSIIPDTPKKMSSTPQKAIRVVSPPTQPRRIEEKMPSPEPVQAVEQDDNLKEKDSELFSGVDSVMAEYMKRMMQKREQTNNDPVMEVTVADEIELDKPNAGSGSEFEW